MLELRRAPVRESLLEALRELDSRLPLEVPVLVGGERRHGGLDSTDPGDAVAAGGPCRAGHGGRCRPRPWRPPPAAFAEWSARPAAERAEVLRGAAARLRERRLELAALMVRECAKPWPEADADVCEAIDFLEYYARAALRWTRAQRCFRCPASATPCATRRAGWWR